MRKTLLFASVLCGLSFNTIAQTGDLEKLLDEGAGKKKEDVTATFKATRIINSSSVENLAHGVLDMRISHRFGRIDQGLENAFGLDNATTRIGLDYGITKWLMVGIGHNTYRKLNDGFIKAKILPQQTKGIPLTVSYFGSISAIGDAAPAVPAGTEYYFSNRLSYVHQLMIARKFNQTFSLQLMPTLVHQNLVDSTKYNNNTMLLGVGGRIKLSRRMALTAEYFYRLNNTDMLVGSATTYNSLSVGLDIETGGHVFQLMFTNSQAIADAVSFTQSTDTWEKGSLHFGFNISRVFTVVKPKEFK